MESYTYRVIKKSWGIAVTIKADFMPLDHSISNCIKINAKFGLINEFKHLTPEEFDCLVYGATRVSEQVATSLTDSTPVLMIVRDIEHNYVDFQKEGIACAVMGLLSNRFHFPLPDIEVNFDELHNRYEFHF